MQRTPTSSTNVKSVGYDKRTRVLEIEFVRQRVYNYTAVHPNTARALLNAASKGKFVWRKIRDKYVFTRV